jgi:predicted O-linked N-acetylglucosamine transferase (SPINDLY family)
MIQSAHARVLSPLLQQGLKFLHAGDAGGAEVLFDMYIGRHPEDADGHNLSAVAKHTQGRSLEAIARLETAITLSPREPLFVVNLAGMLDSMNRASDGLRVIDEFLTRVPGQLEALLQRINLLHHLWRLDEAVSIGRMAVAFHRDNARAHHGLGLALIKQAKFEDAAAAFSEAVARDPAAVDSWLNRGVALKESGRLAEAEESYRRALALSPRDAIVHNNLANVVNALGRHGEAVVLYKSAIEYDPAYADAKANLGTALRDAGQVDEALSCLEAAVAQHPRHATLLNALGNTLRYAQRTDEAIEILNQAVALSPGYAEAYNNLGLAYAINGRLPTAHVHLKRAAELKPESAIISNNLGALLLRMFKFPEAVAALSNAVARDPEYDEALINLGIAHYMRGEGPEATAAYRRVLARHPDNGFARYSLGVALLEDQQLSEAEAEIRRALELDPANALALNTLGVLRLEQHFVTEARNAMRDAAAVNTRSAPIFYSNYAFASLYEPDVSNAEILSIHKEYGRRFSSGLPDIARPHTNLRDRARRLRLAYLSPDFRGHSVSYFFEAILDNHDRANFEVYLYSDTSRTDAITDRMRAGADLWIESAGLTPDTFAQRLRDDGIDILINLGGHTSGNRLPVCALKPVPVQIEYLGYPDTSGVTAMDYRITDGRADPVGEAEKWSTEELVRLPACFHCYRPPRSAPPVAPAPFLEKGYVTFASFNVLPKVTAPAISAWAEIMKALPNSRFFIKCKQMRDPHVQERVLAQFAAHGIDPARIGMAAFVASVQDHLNKYAGVDLALDTFPYNGTTTTCESLYMGVPVLTIAGDNHRGRVGVSLLTAMGLAQDFVASSPADYIARAIAFGKNPARLAEVRSALRPTMERSALRDEAGFTRTLEATYRTLWTRWCDGPQTYGFQAPPELRPEDSIQGVQIKALAR